MLGERAVMKRVLILDSTTRTGSRTASLMDAFCSGLDPECVYTELLRLSEQNLKPLYGESLQERDRLLAAGSLGFRPIGKRASVGLDARIV